MKTEEAGQLLFVNVLGAKCLEKTPEEELAEVIRKAEEEAARNAAKSA